MVEAHDDPAVFDRIIAFLATRQMDAPTLDQDRVAPLRRRGPPGDGGDAGLQPGGHGVPRRLTRAEGEIDISLTHLAKRLGVSRTHARRTVTMLQEAGLSSLAGRSNRLILRPAFADGLELYFLGMFAILLTAVGFGEQG